MSNEERNPITCTEIRSLLPAFLADEIPATESRRVQEHLDQCASCRRFREFEAAFDEVLKRGIREETAPPSLVAGVREALRAEASASRNRSGARRSPGVRRWALAASILIALLAPSLVAVQIGVLVPASRAVAGVERVLEGNLVCSACEKVGRSLGEQRGCRAHGHHAAFKCEDACLWELIETDETRSLIMAADRIGDRIELRGVFLDDLGYVSVKSFRYLSGGEQASLDL
jgi:hypothetical protein